MRTKVKLKGGISLIVLVITIIVMIILAAAIILSLSNSGIISKANKAKADTDISNAKDLVAMAHADWMLDEAKIKENDNTITSFSNYAEKKLQEAGYKVGTGEGAYTVTEDGEVYTGLTETARTAIRAGIKVGDVVKGYTVASTTYETSGEENTAPSYIERDPTKQTVTTNTKLTWKYLGVNANGELEIMADYEVYNDTTKVYDKVAVAANTKVKLSGKGGYLKGPDMLNTICEKLYSKDGVGTARSMNIDDVYNILGYTGPKGKYYDTNGNIVTTAEPLTIGEIENKLGTTLSGRTTPDGKDITTYNSDCYEISKTSKNIKNTANKDLVYNAKNTYWLASPYVVAGFHNDCAYFCVCNVYSTGTGTRYMFVSGGGSSCVTFAVRPVVKLDPSVKVEKDATAANTWNISK